MITIAIDGPSASGKGTVAGKLTKEFGILHLNTGALYRAVGLYYLNNNLDVNDTNVLVENLDKINVEIKFENGEQKTYLNNVDVSYNLYDTSEKGTYASVVANNNEVREKMLFVQQNFALNNSVIMEGRDITTVILPNAEFKFFLTADVNERAKRRHKDLTTAGQVISYNEVLDDILDRDKRDSSKDRLYVVEGSIVIDSTNETSDQTAKRIADIIKSKRAKANG